ncbi:MAG: GEVED domain-containing protein [Phycisphaerae bacterium]|nr:GEVED domain-containing protein [Phycisphaerae bacterium]
MSRCDTYPLRAFTSICRHAGALFSRRLPIGAVILAFVLVGAMAQPAAAIVVGVNIDIHQDIIGPVMPNDFHIEGRIESGRPLGDPGGGGWSQPPVLIDHIDDMFPMFNYTIVPDPSMPGENWYRFTADWRLPPGHPGIPFCTIIHLGLFFDVTCHNIVIDLIGWWTRDGVPLQSGSNSGFVPLIGFWVQDQPTGTPQFIQLRNDSGTESPPIFGQMVQMDLVAMTQDEMLLHLGPHPFAELRLDGMQELLPWTSVLLNGIPISMSNPMPFPPDSFFDVFLDGSNPMLMPAMPIFLEPGMFLISRQLLQYNGNSGPEFRWHWEIHGAHPPPPPPPPPPPIAGINVDIHQDNPGGANDFHVEGRIESGPPGGNWSSPPVLIDQVNDLFPFWNIQIVPDFNDPGQNWYRFTADWWGAEIPFCSVLHLGLFFQITDDYNVIIDLVGWWTRDGMPIGQGVNLGYAPTAGFDVSVDMLGRGQRIRMQNGDVDGLMEPGEIPIEIVQMDLTSIPPGMLETTLGPAPFRELRLGGLQETLTWLPVEVDGMPVSETNPLQFWPDSFFDVFFEMPQPGLPTVPAPFNVPPGGFLVARQRQRFINNAGQPDFRWQWEIHGSAPQFFDQADLGDAPDSSNSFGMLMTAYPMGGPAGIIADYPTVYAAGSPPHGPIHWQPEAWAYLGVDATFENEADIGPDEDPSNNIVPPMDWPDMDLSDDGVIVPLNLPHCIATTFNYTVTVTPAGPGTMLFVNVWFDWDRDGDWDDTMTCPDGTIAPEWAVQNQLLALPPGTHVVTTPPFIPWHPPTADMPPIWMRITLAEQPYNPIPAQGYGGAGPPQGYDFGETEDYYFTPTALVPLEPKWRQPPHPDGEGFDAPSDLWWQMMFGGGPGAGDGPRSGSVTWNGYVEARADAHRPPNPPSNPANVSTNFTVDSSSPSRQWVPNPPAAEANWDNDNYVVGGTLSWHTAMSGTVQGQGKAKAGLAADGSIVVLARARVRDTNPAGGLTIGDSAHGYGLARMMPQIILIQGPGSSVTATMDSQVYMAAAQPGPGQPQAVSGADSDPVVMPVGTPIVLVWQAEASAAYPVLQVIPGSFVHGNLAINNTTATDGAVVMEQDSSDAIYLSATGSFADMTFTPWTGVGMQGQQHEQNGAFSYYGAITQRLVLPEGYEFVQPEPVNKVVADDFISDGRPIRAVRWWGSYLDERYQPAVGPMYASNPPSTGNLFGTIDTFTGLFMPIGNFPGAAGGITEIEWSPDGQTLYATTGGGSSMIHTIDPNTSAVLTGVPHIFGALNGLEFDSFGRLLGTFIPGPGGPSNLVAVDTNTGALNLVGPTGFSNIGGLAFDPVSGTLYGVTSGPLPGPPLLLTVNPGTGQALPLAPLPIPASVASLEFTADGRLIAGAGDGNLWQIIPQTGAAFIIGPMGPVNQLSGLSQRFLPGGSEEPYVLDGWLISFHPADEPAAPQPPLCPPDGSNDPSITTTLGLYFAPVGAVAIHPLNQVDCFGHVVYDYRIDLSRCVLICSELDPRTSHIPAQMDGFYEEPLLRYWIDIQAVVGAEWVRVGPDTIIEMRETGHVPPGDGDHFWGWHTSPGPGPDNLCGALDEACTGAIIDVTPPTPQCWRYGLWQKQPWLCDTMPPFPEVHMAFELLTDQPPIMLAPWFVRQPHDATVCVGDMAVFSVEACGSPPMSYQWYQAGAPPVPIPGATSDTLVLGPVAAGDAGGYFVRITNPAGQVDSVMAMLNVVPRGTGDLNGDGLADGDDIQGFMDVLYGVDTDPLHVCAADMDQDGDVDAVDVPLFVNALLGT